MKNKPIKIGMIMLLIVLFITLLPIAKTEGIDAYTVLMLHMNGVNASTTFTDNSYSSHAFTTAGNALIETNRAKFGTGGGAFDGTGDWILALSSGDWNLGGAGAGDFTIDFWVNITDTSDYRNLMGAYAAGNGGWQIAWLPDEGQRLLIWSGTGTSRYIPMAITAGKYYHIAIVRSGSTITGYLNGNKSGTWDDGDFNNDQGTLAIGSNGGLADNPMLGFMDEVRISKGIARWTANFTVPTQEYSSLPFINNILISPNPAYTNSQLNCSADYTDTDGDKGNVSITWYNGSTQYGGTLTLLNVIAGKTISNVTPTGIQAKNEIWNCSINATDANGLASALNSTTITISANFNIVVYAPLNRTNSSTSTPSFVFNYTHVSTTAGNCILYVNNTNVGSNAATISGKNTTITSSTLNNGMNQQWWVQCSQGGELANTTINTIGIDTVKPFINATLPKGEYFTYDLPYPNLPINFTYIEINKDACWYYLNTSNLTIANCQNTSINLATTKNLTMYVYINDSSGNEGYNTTGFSINLLNASHWASQGNVTEGEDITFTLQINSTNITSVNATFYFNGTAYNYGTRQNNSKQANFTKTLTMPYIGGNSFNSTYNWSYQINSFDNFTDKKNITINKIILTDCSGGGSRVFNFTYANEQTLTTGMNGTLQATFIAWKGTKAMNRTYSFNFPNTKSAEICFPSINGSYQADMYGIFTENGYETRSYHLINASVSNVTTNITLYHLNTTDATTVKFTLQDSTSSKLPNRYLKMYRYYPQNDNKTLVEIGKADTSGQTLIQVVEESVDYIFEVYDYDTLVWTTSKIRIKCETTPCTYTITAVEESGIEMDLSNGISYSFNYNNATGYITLTFDSLDSNAKEVTLTVIRRNNTQDFLVSNQTLTSSSGTLQYYIGNLTGTIIGKAYSQNELVSLYIITLYGGTSTKGIFGTDGIIWAGLLVVALALMGTWNPVVSIVMAIAGVMMVSILGIMAIPYYVVTMIIILGVIFILKIRA